MFKPYFIGPPLFGSALPDCLGECAELLIIADVPVGNAHTQPFPREFPQNLVERFETPDETRRIIPSQAGSVGSSDEQRPNWEYSVSPRCKCRPRPYGPSR